MTHYLLSVHNSYDQNFSSKEFRGIYELKKVCIMQNKKNFTSVFEQSPLKSTSKKRHGFIWLLKKETTFLEKRNIIRIKIYLKQRFSLQFKNKSIDRVSDASRALCGRRRMSPLLNILSTGAEEAGTDKTRQASMYKVES